MKSRIYFLLLIIVFGNGCNKGPEQINRAPEADAGPDVILLLPANEIFLHGSALDENGEIKDHTWAKISGPNSFAIQNKTSLNTKVSDLTEGIYLFELRVTDNQDAFSTDIVEVRVMHDRDPFVIAGNDSTIRLPYSRALLTATTVDNDFDTAMYNWTKIAGPGQLIMDSSNSRQTRIIDLVEGSYQFEVTVTDRTGNTGKDTMSITVQRDPNLYTRDTILQVSSLSCPWTCNPVIDNVASIVPPGQPFLVYTGINNGWWIIPPSTLVNNYPDQLMLYEMTYSIQNGSLIIHNHIEFDFSVGVPLFKIVY